MKYTKLLYLLLIAVATSFDVLAEDVYKTTDESGAVEFSDKKSPDAEKIEVKPNVVDVDIPVMPESAVVEKPKQTSRESSEELEENEDYGYGGGLRRKIGSTNPGEYVDHRDKQPVTIQPIPKLPVTIQPVPNPVARPRGRR